MNNNNQVSIGVDAIERITRELKEISLLCSDTHLEMKIDELQCFVTSILGQGNKFSAEDLIFEKMVEVKHMNPDLHLKLYMLYRNLVSNRISEEDAIASFEILLGLFALDLLVY